MIRRLCCTAALALGLLVAYVPAAHAATVPPSTWAPKFCTAMQDWQTTIQDKGTELSTALDGVDTTGKSPKAILTAARNKISSFLGDMVKATDQATKEIKQAGAPSSPNGDKISAVFVKGFQAISKEFAKAQSQAKQLPTNSAKAFKTKGKQLGQALSDSGTTLGKGFGQIGTLDEGKQLEAAVKAAPECAFLNS